MTKRFMIYCSHGSSSYTEPVLASNLDKAEDMAWEMANNHFDMISPIDYADDDEFEELICSGSVLDEDVSAWAEEFDANLHEEYIEEFEKLEDYGAWKAKKEREYQELVEKWKEFLSSIDDNTRLDDVLLDFYGSFPTNDGVLKRAILDWTLAKARAIDLLNIEIDKYIK